MIEFQFAQVIGAAPLLCPERTPRIPSLHARPAGAGHRFEDGAGAAPRHAFEALGSARYRAGDVTLVPLCDLTDRRDAANRARSGSIQVLFRD